MKNKLGLLPLVAATFFMVSGGPYGIEGLVQQAGYAGAVAILLVIPLIWALPTGMMVGELAAAIPAEGGFYVWVRRALGPFWGFQEAWLSLAASVFDMAAYPAIFVLSLGQLWPPATHNPYRVLIPVVVILGCVAWNMLGAKAVGDGSIVLGLLLLAPFGAMVALAPHRGIPTGAVHGTWYSGLVIAMWNFMGWDNASTVAQEVKDPQKTYPRTMFWSVAAVALVYIVPILAVGYAGVSSTSWSDGAWVSLAGGIRPWLAVPVLLTIMVSVVGQVNSLTMSYSRIPMAMAEDHLAPHILRRVWCALLLCGTIWILALSLSLERILLMDLLLYGASLILEFVALIVLRIRQPGLARPFRIPGGLRGAIAIAAPPCLLLVIAAVLNRNEKIGEIGAAPLAIGVAICGLIVYPLAKKLCASK
ncbi:MAG TPA: APC family permease [Bryobacteraceae bacterium]|jgi:amino acid transporter|nr:APC family permease [Bryobacteraceae bacterium]